MAERDATRSGQAAKHALTHIPADQRVGYACPEMSTRVLLLTQDAELALELERQLTRLEYDVTPAADGATALDLARSISPDIVVLSVELPGMNGFRLCNRLRKDERLMRVPIVVLSRETSADAFQRHARLDTHADAYMHEPLVLAELVSRIRALAPPAPKQAPEVLPSSALEESPATETVPKPVPRPTGISGQWQAQPRESGQWPRVPPPRPRGSSTTLTAVQLPSAVTAPPVTEQEARLAAELAAAGQELATMGLLRTQLEAQQQKTSRVLQELADARAAQSTRASTTKLPAVPLGMSSRDFLDIRQNLTKKDQELRALGDRLRARETDIAELETKLVALERARNALEASAAEPEKRLAAANGLIATLRADKEQAVKRGDDILRRFERLRVEAEPALRELAAEREGRAADAAAHATAVARLEEEKQRAHGDELARVRSEHEAALAEASARAHRDLADAEAEAETLRVMEVSAKEHEVRAELDAVVAKVRDGAAAAAAASAHAREAEQRRRAEIEATLARTTAERDRARAEAEQRARELSEAPSAAALAERERVLREEHAAKLAELRAQADAEKTAFERALEEEQQARKQAAAEADRKLRALDRAVAALNERRVRELAEAEAARALLQQELAAEQERHAAEAGERTRNAGELEQELERVREEHRRALAAAEQASRQARAAAVAQREREVRAELEAIHAKRRAEDAATTERALEEQRRLRREEEQLRERTVAELRTELEAADRGRADEREGASRARAALEQGLAEAERLRTAEKAAHELALANAKTAFDVARDDAIGGLRASHESALSAARAQHRRELDRSIAHAAENHAAVLARKQREARDEVDAALTAARNEAAAMLARVEADLRTERADRMAAEAALRSSDERHDEATRKLAEAAAVERREREAAHEAAIAETIGRLRREFVEAQRATLDERSAASAAKEREIRTELESTIARIRADLVAVETSRDQAARRRVAEAADAHEKVHEHQERLARLAEERAAERSAHEAENARSQAAHDAALAELSERHRRELAESREKSAAETRSALSLRERELRDEHEAALARALSDADASVAMAERLMHVERERVQAAAASASDAERSRLREIAELGRALQVAEQHLAEERVARASDLAIQRRALDDAQARERLRDEELARLRREHEAANLAARNQEVHERNVAHLAATQQHAEALARREAELREEHATVVAREREKADAALADVERALHEERELRRTAEAERDRGRQEAVRGQEAGESRKLVQARVAVEFLEQELAHERELRAEDEATHAEALERELSLRGRAHEEEVSRLRTREESALRDAADRLALELSRARDEHIRSRDAAVADKERELRERHEESIARERAASTAALADLERALAEEQRRNGDAEAEHVRLRQELSTTQEEGDRRARELADVSRAHESAIARIEQLRQSELANVRAVMAREQAELRRLRDALTEAEARRAREVAELAAAVSVTQQSMTDARMRHAHDLEETVTRIRREMDERREADLESLRQSLEWELSSADGERQPVVRELETRVVELESSFARTKATLEEERRARSDVAAESAIRTAGFEALVASREADIDDLQHEVEALLARVAPLDSDLVVLRTELTMARADLDGQAIRLRQAEEARERDRVVLARARRALADLTGPDSAPTEDP